jgi:plastocyanin
MRARAILVGIAWATTVLGGAAPALGAAVGMVAGTVRLEGTPPMRPPLPVFKHAEVCGAGVPDDRLVVGPGGGVRYAVVSVEGVRGGKAPERDVTLALDSHGCRFEPHVQVAEVGQWLELRNSDPILHNADARLGPETLFNVALPPARRMRKPLARPGLVALTCDVRHTWMSAFIAVSAHPYHTVTDAYGAYEIGELPPGTYRLRVWHEELGTVERSLTIAAGERATVDVSYTLPAQAAASPVAGEEAARPAAAQEAVSPAARQEAAGSPVPRSPAVSGATPVAGTPAAPAGGGTGAIKGTITGGAAPGTPVANAAVLLMGPSIPTAADAAHAVMDQRRDSFVPRVLAIAAGTTVDFPNDDPRLHNVYSASAAKKFDLGMYGEGGHKSVTFDVPGVVAVRCNVHPKMEGYIVVHANPYVAVTDARGSYTITGVPAGSYTVRVWAERLTEKEVPVVVREGQVQPLDVRLEGPP